MTRQNHKRGFNLIEAAIVLAVVGGVIGGIWVGARAVQENNRINQAIAGVLRANSRASELLRPTPQTATSILNQFGWDSGFWGDGFRFNGTTILDPWGQILALAQYNGSGQKELTISFRQTVVLKPIPVSRCINMTAKLSAAVKNLRPTPLFNLFSLDTGFQFFGGTFTTLPFNPTTAQCNNVIRIDITIYH